ncbi:alpha/beta hydrolase [Neorhizobium galegae]|uniref:Lysophospholipase L2 n=1 Tax=Neorhizobium galegae bv. orientalis str. HAMBI 540 TaxID=1028800 RepID=A0A068SRC6_NEOGA|nr:alpha/beta hydrolase [Neorhizobium galegae]CDN48379.1 Lysophospholipase L2 [Neorhizobium galegae bv. orientalis str. HAMBI 540]CDZ46065.1 Alpha/beta hydrolase family protein [Neorhizobium galegae bv. orientalis]
MFDETRRFKSPTGANLAYHYQPPAEPAHAILLISHGLAEHSKRYRAFAEAMAGQGFHVYAFDHRGHGETTAPDAPIGRFARHDGVSLVLEDVKAMRDMAAGAHPGLPVLLFGHSMGGLIALNAAVDHPDSFNAVAVWNSNFHPGPAGRAAQIILRIEKALKGSDVPSGLLPKLTFGAWGKSIPGHRTEFDWLSHDPDIVDAYIADPLCGFDASVSLWLNLFELTFRAPTLINRLAKTLPIHLIGGAEDPATNGGREILWLSEHFKRNGFSNVTTKIWPGTRHETLNDTVRARATAEFAAWARAALPVPAQAI